jgi:hypothetical protein
MARKRTITTPIEAHRQREYDREWHDTSTPANPRFAFLCAQSLVMWTAGADPKEIAEWLETQQDGCVVNLQDQIFAIRGLPPYKRGGVLDGLNLNPARSSLSPVPANGTEVHNG